MDPFEIFQAQTRRQMLGLGARGLGALGAAVCSTLPSQRSASEASNGFSGTLGSHLKPTAKRVIYLFFSGGPSHIDMYDYHPKMREIHGTNCPTASQWPTHHGYDLGAEIFSLRGSNVRIFETWSKWIMV